MRLLIHPSVTGTSTGLGRGVAEIALEKGEIVVATARQPSTLDDLAQRYPEDRLLILPLDVTQQDQVAEAFSEAHRAFGRIDVVFNNAGFGYGGELEAMEETKARAILETNFWGAINVTKESVKCFREANPPGVGGRLLQMSSYAGLVGLPALSFYSASKFGTSDFLRTLGNCGFIDIFVFYRQRLRGRLKLSQLSWTSPGTSRYDWSSSHLSSAMLTISCRIQVTIIEPGWIRSEWAPKSTWSPEHPAYQSPGLLTAHIRGIGWEKLAIWKDAKRSAEAFYKIASVPNPPLHFLVGKDAIDGARKKIAALSMDIDAYETWSDGLEEQMVAVP